MAWPPDTSVDDDVDRADAPGQGASFGASWYPLDASAQVLLPPEEQSMLNSYCGAVALALAVQWRMNDKRTR